MIRNLKVLGLTLVAALALSVMGASAASAQNFHFTSSAENTTLAGAQSGATNDIFKVDAGETECNKATYTGSATGKTTLDVTLTPAYSECQVKPIGSAVVDVNSCSYTFTAQTAPNVKTEILCPPGGSITVTASALGTLKCTIHIAPQTLTGVTVATAPEGDITATVAINGITYSQTAGMGLGACTTKENNNGTYTGKALINGGAATLGLANT